ncbi:uncharacterized protein RSE6_10502 [Rhynchosporium secalis]|uniref:Uncharacterized protein n=1 Tax=Rhynchosporium secalis TaxID=38038 RepID=A0A1E1MKP2_RHYSE|nr:uncharacterized protein RSE6_10502 [Rhynchosporium secalis]
MDFISVYSACGDDSDFHDEDSGGGYVGLESLGFDLSVGGIHIPFRAISQIEFLHQPVSPASSIMDSDANQLGSPNSHTPADYTATISAVPSAPPRARSESADSISSGSFHASISDNEEDDPQNKSQDAGQSKEVDSDSDEARRPDQKRGKGKGKGKQGDAEDEDEEGEQDDGATSQGGIKQVQHKNRYERDFGLRRPHISEAKISFIRDGWSTSRATEASFQPGGGAWIGTTKRGDGAISITAEEDIFRVGLEWALGKPRPSMVARNDQYRDVRTEAPLLPPADSKRKASDAEAQQMIDAIAGKHIDLAAFKDLVKDTAAQYGPLPASMQVDPVRLQPGPATDALIKKMKEVYDKEKRDLDGKRRKLRKELLRKGLDE